jgi:excisionase family DNA binding protein
MPTDTYGGPGNGRDDRLSVGDAAKYLGVSVSTLQRWDREKILVAERTVTNQRRYRRSALDTAIETQGAA